MGPGGAARIALGHRRRRGAQWGRGRPQRVPVQVIKYKEKTEITGTTQNPDESGNVPVRLEISPKT